MTLMAVSAPFGKHNPLPFMYSRNNRFGSYRVVITEPAWRARFRQQIVCGVGRDNILPSNLSSKELMLKQARLLFSDEISFSKRDEEVSLVKALLLVSAEDEVFISLNRDKDRLAACTEGRDSSRSRSEAFEANVDRFPIAGKTMSMWFSSFDFLVQEVRDIMALKGGYTKPVDVLRAVSTVLFQIQKFKRTITDMDARSYYLHIVMTLGSGSGLLLSVIYMEVCKRLGISMKTTQVGEEVLMWPHLDNLQECFESSHGKKSWFLELLGFQHQSHLSSFLSVQNASLELSRFKFTSNRDMVGIVLSHLKDLHWKEACKTRPEIALTDPLHPVSSHAERSVGALLRPKSLRLALMACERLLLLHPENWVFRRDHGLLLYYSRRYGEAVQELSICTAFAPTAEAEMLENFVEKLHLLRIESNWSSVRSKSTRV